MRDRVLGVAMLAGLLHLQGHGRAPRNLAICPARMARIDPLDPLLLRLDDARPMTSIGKRCQEGLAEATRFFMGKSNVQEAARRLEARLQELQIPYAVAGGLAVVAHGHLRVTVDVDVLLTPEGLQRFKDASLGRGWSERVAGGRGLRDAVGRVLSLPVLIELKLASGIWTRDRPRDFDDVIQLIRLNGLPLELAGQLHAGVREKYRELWDAAQHPSGEP